MHGSATGTVKFQIEPLRDCRAEIELLLPDHYDEIAQFKEVQKLDPNWALYQHLENIGRLWILTARHGSRLVGYLAFTVSRHMHYKQLVVATEDLHYLAPEYRKGLTGYRLLARAAREMQRAGGKMIVFRTKGLRNDDKLYERLGCVLHDKVFVKISED